MKNGCVKMQNEQNTLINKKFVPHLIMRKIRSDKSALAAWRQQQAAASKKMKNKLKKLARRASLQNFWGQLHSETTLQQTGNTINKLIAACVWST